MMGIMGREMKNLRIFIACAAILFSYDVSAAVYPTYSGARQNVQYQPAQQQSGNYGYAQQQYAPVNNRMVTAANPNRVTGAIPRWKL